MDAGRVAIRIRLGPQLLIPVALPNIQLGADRVCQGRATSPTCARELCGSHVRAVGNAGNRRPWHGRRRRSRGRKGFNGIRSGSPYHIRPGDSKNGAGPFFTTRSPADLTAPGAFKKLGITSSKSEYVMQFQVSRSVLVPWRGDRGRFIFEIPSGVFVPRVNSSFFGPTVEWSGS